MFSGCTRAQDGIGSLKATDRLSLELCTIHVASNEEYRLDNVSASIDPTRKHPYGSPLNGPTAITYKHDSVPTWARSFEPNRDRTQRLSQHQLRLLPFKVSRIQWLNISCKLRQQKDAFGEYRLRHVGFSKSHFCKGIYSLLAHVSKHESVLSLALLRRWSPLSAHFPSRFRTKRFQQRMGSSSYSVKMKL